MQPEDQQPNSNGKGTFPSKVHQFKPGQSGNPGGRPKGQSVTAAIRELLRQEHNGKSLAAVLAERWFKEALAGKSAHLEMLLNRTEGAVNQRLRIEDEPPGLTGGQMLEAIILAVPAELRPQILARIRENGKKQMEAWNQERRHEDGFVDERHSI